MSKDSPFMLISAGGTGGHMSPASALASEFIKKGVNVELVTDIRGAKYIGMFPDIPVHIIKSGTSHAGLLGKLKGVINLAAGIIQGLSLVKKRKPDAVIGFGGYPSVPAVLAAQIKGIPTGLHEQNAVLGKANVFLAAKAKFIALSLPLPEDIPFSYHVIRKSKLIGNPVRPEIIDIKETPYPVLGQEGPFNLFVMGGSLGATVFSTVVPQALTQLPQIYKERLSVIQQCREADMEEARELYNKSGIKNVTLAPFFDDVDRQLAKAHLFIGRSGASTVAEISIAGRPAVYVPYPHHKDQQQKRNAESIVHKGGAWLMEEKDFTPEALQDRMMVLLEVAEALPKAAMHAKECGLPDAAKDLASLSLELIKQQE